MDNERVNELIDGIEANFRELVEITGEDHISSFIVDNNFNFMIFDDKGNAKIDIWREGKNNE